MLNFSRYDHFRNINRCSWSSNNYSFSLLNISIDAQGAPRVLYSAVITHNSRDLFFHLQLKMGIPIDAVRHALQKEGKDPKIIDMDPSKSYDSQTHGFITNAKVASPALKDDPEFSKFFKVTMIDFVIMLGFSGLMFRFSRLMFP